MSYLPLFVVGQNDTLPPITVNLTDINGNAVNLTTASNVVFAMSNAFTGLVVTYYATILNASTGKVEFTWSEGNTLTPGVFVITWTVNWSNSTITTYPQHDYDTIVVMNDLALGYPNVTATFNTIWNSVSAPTSANGNNGDFWYDTTTGYFYGPKANGSWPAGFLLNANLIPLNNLAAPTGNLSMAGFQITNLATATGPGQAVSYSQLTTTGITVTQAPYSADPTGTSDSTSAFNSAISALSSSGGGTLIVPPGKYIFSGSTPVTLNNVSNIRIQGAGGFAPTGATNAGTIFYYQGTSTADFIQCQNSFGIQIKDISFNGASSSWTGNYIGCEASGQLTHNLVVENCYFYGGNTTSAWAMNLCNTQTVDVNNCFFVFGGGAIQGSTSSLTSNEVSIEHCYFDNVTVEVQNPSTTWTIKDSYFTGAGITHTSGVAATALCVHGCTFGGGTQGIQAYGAGINIFGNYISGTTGVNIDVASNGVVVKGNEFNTCTTGVQTTDTVGADISDNYFVNCTTATSYNSTSTNLVTNGNFTNGTTSWTATGSAAQSVIYSDSIGGDSEVLQVITSGSAFGGTQQATIACSGSTTYQLSCWVKLISGAGEPVATIVDSASTTGTSAPLTTTGTWTRLAASITTASGATSFTVKIATTVSTAATTFEVCLVTARKGPTLLPELFSLNYLGNNYSGGTNTITGNYKQCGVVEDPVGTITRYGNTVGGLQQQASGYDTFLGNSLYVPNNISVGALATAGQYGGGAGGVIAVQNATTAPTSGVSNEAILYSANGRIKWVGSDGIAYQGGSYVLATTGTTTISSTTGVAFGLTTGTLPNNATYLIEAFIPFTTGTYTTGSPTAVFSFAGSASWSTFVGSGSNISGPQTGVSIITSSTSTVVTSPWSAASSPFVVYIQVYATVSSSGAGTLSLHSYEGLSGEPFTIDAGAVLRLTPIG